MEILSHENFGNVTSAFQKTVLKQYLDNQQINEAKYSMEKDITIARKDNKYLSARKKIFRK